MRHVAYIALGSNLGDRLANLKSALADMRPEVIPTDCSPIYETPPWGYPDQPEFLNQVIRAETSLNAEALLVYLKNIEIRLGRQETFRFGPRVIDLDIIFFDAEVIDSPPLKIPHPQLKDRAFVLLPLAQLAPGFHHPVSDLTVETMLSRIDVKDIDWYAPGGCGIDSG
jgi:2-amino-4-hydroxy-6-hydroxymethyldihydropteridine diphosphokinase